MSKYFPPTFGIKQFHCIYCNVYAKQEWVVTSFGTYGNNLTIIKACQCEHCSKISYWDSTTETMLIPSESPIQPPHEDMPEEIIQEYNEARSIFAKSPRASSALLRLALQKLLPILGAEKDNINKGIQDLVDKGLPIIVQQALDICRVIGNNAIHPGEIELNETPEKAAILFEMINFIVEDRISKPKQIERMYQSLPQGALDAIKTRKA
ncbi:DUF4145 domain-containing protein [Aliarcobacter butzleri]|uniref:DUF4145 domain-containing protein n=1 Tax=Aliarcobacter butzleri TaxID=28197 RepID=UPI0012613A72|nr:DUF4145 domain-containing protein [Aliarcobacter butzleri]